MKRQKNTLQRVNKIYLIVGLLMIIATPMVQSFTTYILTRNCPIQWNNRECGLAKGLENADVIMFTSVLWVAIGVVVMVIGLTNYLAARKRR